MHFRLFMRMMFLVPVIVSAAGVDPAYEELLFHDSSVPLDLVQSPSPSPFDLSALPSLLDRSLSPEDIESRCIAAASRGRERRQLLAQPIRHRDDEGILPSSLIARRQDTLPP